MELEVCGGVLRRLGEFLGAVGTDDVEADQIGSDGATSGAARAVVKENLGHAVGGGWIPDDFRGLWENMPSAQLPW